MFLFENLDSMILYHLILMDVEGEVCKLSFSDIQKAKLVMTDELMAFASTRPS